MPTAPQYSETIDTLRVLLLSDGRPGHYSLSEGITAAIQRVRPTKLEWREVRRPGWLPARALSTLLNAGMPARQILSAIYRLDPVTLPKTDIVVSAGGNTLAANIASARLLGVPNIFYGSLRRYRPQDFSLALSSYKAQHPHQLMTLKPSKRDLPAGLPPQAGEANQFGLIIGGNSGTVSYQTEDWHRLLEAVQHVSKKHVVSWIVSNSPRTPPSVSDALVELQRTHPAMIKQFIDIRQSGTGSLDGLLANVSAIICTADSSTMLSECVWARRPVIAVTPEKWSLPKDETSYRNWLIEEDWVRQTPIKSLQPETVPAMFREIKPLAGNPLDDLAAQIKQRIPQLFAAT